MLLYYITDRRSLPGTDEQQRARLLDRIGNAAQAGVDYIQLREKDLPTRELEQVACQAVRITRERSAAAKLLINGRADVALASGADGVHLPSDNLPAAEIRALWARCNSVVPLIGVSAHSVRDVRYAEAQGADFCVLAPIFEKAKFAQEGIGVAALRAACLDPEQPENTEAAPRSSCFPVLGLGGITLANARDCLFAGASGLAGIRLFQQGDITETVRRLRELQPVR
jgi:thiamine-phosphate pyrophosphorylase